METSATWSWFATELYIATSVSGVYRDGPKRNWKVLNYSACDPQQAGFLGNRNTYMCNPATPPEDETFNDPQN
jgi:hypothetical protein